MHPAKFPARLDLHQVFPKEECFDDIDIYLLISKKARCHPSRAAKVSKWVASTTHGKVSRSVGEDQSYWNNLSRHRS
jgi:hypothetical protein